MTPRRTTRWNVALVAASLSSGTGVLLAEPTLLLLSIPAIVFAVYSHATPPPTPTLDIERSIRDANPAHGQEVEVTLTLRNTGDRPLFDIRFLDGLPPMLAVQNGSARHATALGPGDETTFSYTVVAKHGVHSFEPSQVVLRDPSGSVVVETTLTEETELACRTPIQTAPLAHPAHRVAGASTTRTGSHGLEFSHVRSYRPGDPPNRIDWNRYARDGELTTVSFDEDRARRTVLCLDARNGCYRSANHDEPHAVLYERAAAREILDAIADSNEQIGLAVFGTGFRWVAPDRGSSHVERIRRTLDDPETLPLEPPSEESDREPDETRVRTLRTKMERGTGVILLSPLLDRFPLDAARSLEAEGHPVTILSPDVTTTESLGTSFARLQRDNRVDTIRRATIPVIDWEPDTPLEPAIRDGLRR